MNIPEAVVKKQREALEQAKRKMRIAAIMEGIKRGVANDDYMNTETFYRKAIAYNKKKGTPLPSVKETVARIKSYYATND